MENTKVKILDILYEYIGEFETGKIYTIAARPGMGKTVFATNIYKELAGTARYIKTELSHFIEIVSQYKGINISETLDIDRLEYIVRTAPENIIIIHDFNFINKYNYDGAKRIEKMATKYQKVIIVLTSISRRRDFKRDKRPKRCDLIRKYCHTLKKRSEVIIFLFREKYYSASGSENLEIYIHKKGSGYKYFSIDFIELLKAVKSKKQD